MDVRSGLSEAKIIITEQDVEEKFNKITGSSFQILKDQLEEKRQSLIIAINRAQSLESKSQYYSTLILKKKLNECLVTALQFPEGTIPLSSIHETYTRDFDFISKKMSDIEKGLKVNIKNNLELTQQFATSIQKMEEPLEERLRIFKGELIETLQAAANEYRLLLVSQGVWEKKFPEFTDKFGCVVKIIGCVHPYELDSSVGFGLQFGHEIREARKCPVIEPKIDYIKKLPLSDLEIMINSVIAECIYYSSIYSSSDSYDVLNIIKKHYNELAKKYRNFYQFEEEGRFYRRLKKFKLLQNEEMLKTAPLHVAKTELEKLQNAQDGELLKEITKSLNELQQLTDMANKKAEENLAALKQESFIAINLLSGPAEKHYKTISTLTANMKMLNAETKTNMLATASSAHKVQVGYEDAIRMAKFRDKIEFERHEKLAIEALKAAENSFKASNDNIAQLQGREQVLNKKLKYAKEYYDGSIHRIPEAIFARECKKYEKSKTAATLVAKEYTAVLLLPNAIKKYGEIIFHCADIQAEIISADQFAKNVSQAVLLMWSAFNETFDDEKLNNPDKVKECSKKMDEQLEAAEQFLKMELEKISNAKKIQDEAQQKLLAAKQIFTPEIHNEHQEIFDATGMQYNDAIKQKELSEAMIAGVRDLPASFVEYTQIVMSCAVIRDLIDQTKAACVQVNLAVKEISKAHDESHRLAKAGVIKISLEKMAFHQLEEAKLALQNATSHLKKAEEIKLAEEKKLADAKARFTKEMHAKPQAIFDVSNSSYADAIVMCGVAEAAVTAANEVSKKIQENLAEAKQIEKEKQIATQLRQVILKTILNNMDLWRIGKWGGGVDFHYAGKSFRIPHGVAELLSQILSSADHHEWIKNITKTAASRDQMGRTQWKYTLFHIRDDATTGVLYHAIKKYVKLTEGSAEALEEALAKIPGLRVMEEKPMHLVV